MPEVGTTQSKSRRKSHSHGDGMAQRLQVLGIVVGGLCLLISVVLAVLAALHQRQIRPRVVRLAAIYAAAGAACFIVRFFLYTLPHWRRLRSSPSYVQRRDQSHRRRKRSPLTVPAGDPSESPRGGGVLVLVLILLALVAALVVQSQLLAANRLHREQTNLTTSELRRAADDAARAALQRLADDADLQVDYSNETWAAAEDVSTPLGVSTHVRVDDESRFFDLNNLSLSQAPGERPVDDIVMDIMTLCGDYTPAMRVDSVIDFMDTDESGTHESDFYRHREPPYACANRVLYGWGELLEIEGWTREMFASHLRSGSPDSFDANLADCVTVIPVAREKPLPVNVNTAGRETLMGVLGIGQDRLVEMILTLRSLKPIRDLDTLALLTESEYFESVRPFLDVRSRVFRVVVRAYADGRTETLRVLASRDASGRVDVLQWLF